MIDNAKSIVDTDVPPIKGIYSKHRLKMMIKDTHHPGHAPITAT